VSCMSNNGLGGIPRPSGGGYPPRKLTAMNKRATKHRGLRASMIAVALAVLFLFIGTITMNVVALVNASVFLFISFIMDKFPEERVRDILDMGVNTNVP